MTLFFLLTGRMIRPPICVPVFATDWDRKRSYLQNKIHSQVTVCTHTHTHTQNIIKCLCNCYRKWKCICITSGISWRLFMYFFYLFLQFCIFLFRLVKFSYQSFTARFSITFILVILLLLEYLMAVFSEARSIFLLT